MKRVYHTWDKWECYPAGFYEPRPPDGVTPAEAVAAYTAFLRDTRRFEAALERVIHEWKNSCEHYLSNPNMNRIAWLGQAAMCIETRVPACYRGGFNALTDKEKAKANSTALEALNAWLVERGEDALTSDDAEPRTKMDLY